MNRIINTVVSFDKTKSTPEQMTEAIKKKGCKVLDQEVISELLVVT